MLTIAQYQFTIILLIPEHLSAALFKIKICWLNDTCICLRQEICYTIFSNKQTSSISKYLYRKCYAEPYLTERNFSTTQKTKFSFKVGFSPSKKTLSFLQWKLFKKWWKMFIFSEKLFSLSRYLHFILDFLVV